MRYVIGFLLIWITWGCSNSAKVEENYTQGTTKIISDESFEPIVDDQLIVFSNSYPKANVAMTYEPEVVAANLFLSDSFKVAILSRKLSAAEEKHFTNKNIVVRTTRFALDGVALITHTSSPDTGVLVDDIVNVMAGRPGAISSLVFDNANSSTVRYLKQLSGVSALPPSGVYALKTNQEVIRYVHDNPGTIGVIGMNWIEQPDSATAGLIPQLRFVGVKNSKGKPGDDAFYLPSQNTLAMEKYALSRELFIIDCSGGPGLGAGFASFISGERGQRLVLKSGLLPSKLPSRQILINNKAKK